jgi:hypothetical protein
MLKRDRAAQPSSPWTSPLTFLLVTLALPACHFSKPDIGPPPPNPTFEADVKLLLADHCLLCHAYPATRTAPTDFRLDVYDDSSDGVHGAKYEAARFVKATLDDKMPPSAAWGDGVGPNGKQLLQNWLNTGSPDK